MKQSLRSAGVIGAWSLPSSRQRAISQGGYCLGWHPTLWASRTRSSPLFSGPGPLRLSPVSESEEIVTWATFGKWWRAHLRSKRLVWGSTYRVLRCRHWGSICSLKQMFRLWGLVCWKILTNLIYVTLSLVRYLSFLWGFL